MCLRPNAVGAVTMRRPDALFAPTVSASSARAQLAQDAVAVLVERRALGRERHLARRALEELHAEALLELVDAPARPSPA